MKKVLVKSPNYRYHDLRNDGMTAKCGRQKDGVDGWYVAEQEGVSYTGRCGHCYSVAYGERKGQTK